MAEDINKNLTWNGSNQDDDNPINLGDIWALVWGHKWWFFLSLLIALCIAIFYLYKTPKMYSSFERIIIENDQTSTTLSDLSTSMRRNAYYGVNVANEMQAMKSPDLMTKVVERLGLETNYTDLMFLRERELYNRSPFYLTLLGDNKSSSFSFIVKKKGEKSFTLENFMIGGAELEAAPVKGNLGDSLVTPVGSLRLTESPYLYSWSDDVRVSWANARNRAGGYAGRLGVAGARDESSVVTLSLRDHSPDRAAHVLATLLDVYNEQWIANKNRATANTSEFIKERLLVLEEELGGIEENIKDFKSKHQLTNIDAVSNQYLQQSSAYSSKAFENSNQLSVAQYIRGYLNDPSHSRSLIPQGSGLNSGNIESQISSYNNLLMKRDQLLKESSESNPYVADLNANLDAMKSSVLRSVDNYISSLQIQQDRINAQENAILGRIASTSGQELQLLSIGREQKVKEALYTFLLQKREENELASQLSVANTRLLVAPVSGSPVSPVMRNVLLIALLLGLGIPFAFFFLRLILNTTVHTRSDVAKLKVPFLAEIPQMAGKKGLIKKKSARFDDSNCNIIVEGGKRDMMNEAFRVLRTNLDMMVGHDAPCHVIMVTSFNPNAGKTFTIMNMAASMAIKGAKTLLLDLDLRKATLSKALGKNTTGVSAYLNGRIDDYHPDLQEVSENLYLLSVGSIPPNPSELLVSEKFRQMVVQLRSEFKYIFIDCPPVDVVADTAIVSGSADITVFIVRAGLFDKRALPAVDELYASGKYNRMALILNGVEQVQGTYGHYGSYGYGYGHYGYGYGHYGYGNYGYGYGEQDGDGKGKKKHHASKKGKDSASKDDAQTGEKN